MRLNNYHAYYFEMDSYFIFGPLVSKDYRVYHKTHIECDSLNAVSDKSLISRSANSHLLKTYDLILDILLS
jgi:hypothetical protein